MITINAAMLKKDPAVNIATAIVKDTDGHGLRFTSVHVMTQFNTFLKSTENDDLLRMLLDYLCDDKRDMYVSLAESWWMARAMVKILRRARERGLVSTLNNGGCNGRSDAVSMD